MNPKTNLIDRALEGVRVVICSRCKGWGTIGLESMHCQCFVCGGSGKTTTSELER